MTNATRKQRPADRFLHDSTGKLVIAQAPNLPFVGWFLFTILGRLPFDGATSTALGNIGRAFLFTWAYLEITDGVNYFRRLLGAVVMVAVLVGYFVR